MPNPILVGYDPDSADAAPVLFAVAAARFTGAPLVIGSVHADAETVARFGHCHVEAGLPTADQAHGASSAQLVPDDVAVEFRALPGSSPPGRCTMRPRSSRRR